MTPLIKKLPPDAAMRLGGILFYTKVPTNGGVQDMIEISPKACLILIFKKVLRAGCDEESTEFHLGEELLHELFELAAYYLEKPLQRICLLKILKRIVKNIRKPSCYS